MNDYADLTDAADTEWEACMRQQEEEEWLRDEQAQKEWNYWLDLMAQMQ